MALNRSIGVCAKEYDETRRSSQFYNFSWEKGPDANTKFFPTRRVPAPDDSLTKPSTPETEVDRKRRDELIDLIERRNSFSVDETIKDVHP